LFFSFFQVLHISLLFFFFHLKNVWLTVQVCCLFYFLFQSTFFKGKARVGFLIGFIVFFQMGFLKQNW